MAPLAGDGTLGAVVLDLAMIGMLTATAWLQLSSYRSATQPTTLAPACMSRRCAASTGSIRSMKVQQRRTLLSRTRAASMLRYHAWPWSVYRSMTTSDDDADERDDEVWLPFCLAAGVHHK